MLVMLIIAVAAALVAPAIGNRLKSGDVRRTAVQLRAAMELMRVRAVRLGQEEVLVVNPRDNVYWREGGGETVEVAPESGVLSAQGQWIREHGEIEFHFYPSGMNSGGLVRIAQGRGAAITAYMIYLDPLLGTATLWRDE
jgi:type II secretory pathway pseudopilin PulG